jgi:hypothetical protein
LDRNLQELEVVQEGHLETLEVGKVEEGVAEELVLVSWHSLPPLV